MKKLTALLYSMLPILLTAQRDTIQSGVVDWTDHLKSGLSVTSPILFEGGAHDMKWLRISGNDFYNPNGTLRIKASDSEEQIIIIRSGELKLRFKDSTYTPAQGSIILLMPGDSCFLSMHKKMVSYYTLQYRSSQPKNSERGQLSGSSQFISYDTVHFKPNAKGGRRDFLNRSTAMSRRVEIHASTLQPGFKSHDPHMHTAPEIIIVTEGQTEMQIGKEFYPGKEGSVYFLASNNLHAIRNAGKENCTYFAIQLER